MINLTLPKALYPIFEGEARYRVAYGGRGGAKSWGLASVLAVRAYQKPLRILCARELQGSIKDSVHALLASRIEALGLTGFDIGRDYLRHVNGSEFIFRGLRSNAHEIKSMEGIDIAWVEEAQKVSHSSWDLLIPTIRKPKSEIWVSFNPEYRTDSTSIRFKENTPPDTLKAEINYTDNPWLPEPLCKEAVYMREVDPIGYQHVWGGGYKDPSQGGNVVKGWTFANVDEGITYNPEETIHLTMDFNVDPMCWGLAHLRYIDGQRHYHFFDEIAKENTNLSACLESFIARYGKHTAGIVVTGDANSGRARSDMDDLTRTRWNKIKNILSDHGVRNFTVESNKANPSIAMRIEVFNSLVCNADYTRRVKASPKCEKLIYSMLNLRYKISTEDIYIPTPKEIEKEPHLKWHRDDIFDAASYLTWQYDPIKLDAPSKNREAVVPKGLTDQWKR